MAGRVAQGAHESPKAEGAAQRPRGAGAFFTAAAVAAVIVLLGVYAAVSWLAVRGKSATWDEVGHLAAACANTRHLDLRANREDPPLWKYWAGIPQVIRPPELRLDSPEWRAMPKAPAHLFKWSRDVLYRTPGNDADAIVARSRAMMLALAVALGAVVALWSWRLAGPVAAVVATAAFALDPNFLAH